MKDSTALFFVACMWFVALTHSIEDAGDKVCGHLDSLRQEVVNLELQLGPHTKVPLKIEPHFTKAQIKAQSIAWVKKNYYKKVFK